MKRSQPVLEREAETRLVYSTEGLPAPAEDAARPPSACTAGERVQLRLERRASGRVVTVLAGLGGSKEQVASLARTLRVSCGAGGTVKRDLVELQGDHREKAAAVLRALGFAVGRDKGPASRVS